MNGAPSIDRKGETLVFLREDSVTPREVWALRLASAPTARRAKGRAAAAAPKPLTDTNPQVRDLLSFPKELVSWKGADGWDIEGLLVYPAGYAKGSRVPLALNVHGGPAGTHSNTFTPAPRLWGWPLFAQKGYAILFPNPRGSGGYGEKFRAANVRDWGVKDYEDLMKGVDALVERGIADPERLTVNGWSYGGFMTSTIVTKTDRFKSAIVGAAVTNLASFTGTADIPDFARSYFRSWPWEDPQVYVDRSALFHAGNVKTPSLVVHGDKDERVPVSQGWEFYNALKAVGRAHRPPRPAPPAPRHPRAEAAADLPRVVPPMDRDAHARAMSDPRLRPWGGDDAPRRAAVPPPPRAVAEDQPDARPAGGPPGPAAGPALGGRLRRGRRLRPQPGGAPDPPRRPQPDRRDGADRLRRPARRRPDAAVGQGHHRPRHPHRGGGERPRRATGPALRGGPGGRRDPSSRSPSSSEAGVIGCLNVESDREAAFSAEDAELLEFFASSAAVSIEKALLHRQVLEKQRIEDQLKVAREVQSGLLPGAPPRLAGYDIAAVALPTWAIGGDYYDYVPLGEGRLGLVVADVSGKGIPAALIMATFRAALRAEMRRHADLRPWPSSSTAPCSSPATPPVS